MRAMSRKPVEAMPAFFGPLAKLPTFLERTGQRAAAAWNRAFTARSPREPAAPFAAIASGLGASRHGERGRVTLVGAGPGDAEMLTLKAVRAMQSADVILYDDLVSQEVLAFARSEAKRILVGKRGGRESCAQSDINDLMVELASQGKAVVRLKSGDPMIFGRAGEEIERLTRERIPVDVVPGVTAASAMAAQLGLSLTHRDDARSVRFVTGHSKSGELPEDLDWSGLADPLTTLVVYMGARTSSALARRLIAASLDPGTPVVAMSSVSRATSRAWRGTLADLAAHGTPKALPTPVLIGIGAAFARGARGTSAQKSRGVSPAMPTDQTTSRPPMASR